MKMNHRSLSFLALAAVLSLTACKKNENVTPTGNPEAEAKTHNDDQNQVASNIDDITGEADLALQGTAGFAGGRVMNVSSICGATATADTTGNARTITITYNGADCGQRHHRSGKVVLSMPGNVRWRNAGAAVTISYQDVKIKRLSDNKSITINGTQTLTNVSGGLLLLLSSQQSITHTLTSNNMSITFNDNTQRTWSIARQRTFSFNNGLVMTVSGTGTNGNITNATEWGLNRFGQRFTTAITKPIVVRQDCDFRITEGEITHTAAVTAVAKFGLNSNGEPTGCPGANRFFYNLSWTGANGAKGSITLPY